MPSCKMGGMDGWKRLGEEIIKRRVDLGHVTQQAFASSSRLSSRLLSDLERGRRTSYDPATLVRLERALRWVPGSVQAILDGGEPTPMPEDRASFYIEGPSDEVALIALIASSGLPTDGLERVAAYIAQRRADFNRDLMRDVRRMIDAERGAPTSPGAPHADVEHVDDEPPPDGIPYSHLAN